MPGVASPRRKVLECTGIRAHHSRTARSASAKEHFAAFLFVAVEVFLGNIKNPV